MQRVDTSKPETIRAYVVAHPNCLRLMLESLETAPSVYNKAGVFAMLCSVGEICSEDVSLLSTIPKADQVFLATAFARIIDTAVLPDAFFVENVTRTGQQPRYALDIHCMINASLKWIRIRAFNIAAIKPGGYVQKITARFTSYIDAAPGRKLGCCHSEGYLNLVHDASVRAGFEPEPDVSFLVDLGCLALVFRIIAMHPTGDDDLLGSVEPLFRSLAVVGMALLRGQFREGMPTRVALGEALRQTPAGSLGRRLLTNLESTAALTAKKTPGDETQDPLRVPMSLCRKCSTPGLVSGGPLLKCSRCLSAFYCGTECQKADWPVHKGQCTPASREQGHSLKATQALLHDFMKKNYVKIVAELRACLLAHPGTSILDMVLWVDFMTGNLGVFRLADLQARRCLPPHFFPPEAEGKAWWEENLKSITAGCTATRTRLQPGMIQVQCLPSSWVAGTSYNFRIAEVTQARPDAPSRPLFSDELISDPVVFLEFCVRYITPRV